MSFPKTCYGKQEEKDYWEWIHISTDQEFKRVLPMTHWLFRERNGLMAGECKIEVRKYVLRSHKPPRSPNFSRVRLTYLFSTDEKARKHYTLFGTSRPRMGLLLEDFDMLAAEIANRHTGRKVGSYTVTRSATIQMDGELDLKHDLVVDSFVKKVGNTSITVYVSLNQVNKTDSNDVQFMGELLFVLVFLNSKGEKQKAPILEVNSNEEEHMRKQGAHISSYRTPRKTYSPSEDEMRQLQSWLTPDIQRSCSIIIPSELPLLSNSTSPTNMFLDYHKIMHYQQRNTNNVIYGGYLMREGLEQAYLTVLDHLQPSRMKLIYYSLTFDSPVAIGTILKLRSQIAYIKGTYVFVMLNAQAINMADFENQMMETPVNAAISNKFLVVLQVDSELAPLWPTTYSEGLRILDAQRRAEKIFKDLKGMNEWAASRRKNNVRKIDAPDALRSKITIETQELKLSNSEKGTKGCSL